MKKQLFILLASIFIAAQAQALFEIRAGYGINTPDEENIGTGSEISTVSGLNLDAIVELPLLPFGFGLRYESMGFDTTFGGQDFESELTRTSLLVNYRIIDLFAYFGIIGTIGFQNDMTIKNAPIVGDIDYSADLTYSAGVEGGVSLGLIMVGAELGYLIGTYEDNSSNEVDADGIYAKAIVGVGF